MPDEIWMHVQNGTLSCHTTPINSASVAFVPLLRAAKAEARIAALEAALGWAQTAASDWKRLAFDLVRAAGGTQRISMLTAMNAHTEDTLEAHQDHETGDMVYRVYRATQRPMPLTATELPLSARVEAKIARECFANEPGPTQGTSPLQRQENKGEIDGERCRGARNVAARDSLGLSVPLSTAR